jgi:hypothetical protein
MSTRTFRQDSDVGALVSDNDNPLAVDSVAVGIKILSGTAPFDPEPCFFETVCGSVQGGATKEGSSASSSSLLLFDAGRSLCDRFAERIDRLEGG